MKSMKLMADYQCYPLWNMSPGEYGDMNPDDLPISKELKLRLFRWAALYDETLDLDCPLSSGFKNEEQELDFKREGERLLECLRNELGPDYMVSLKV